MAGVVAREAGWPRPAAWRAQWRRLAATLAAATLLAALASLAPGSPVATTCAAAGTHHAAVVVEHGDGTVVTRCVAFAADSISGEDLLNLSGIAWSSQTFGGFGDAVCALDSEPAHYSTCPGKDDYWSVFTARAGALWQLDNVGISSTTIRDGDAEGFRYLPAVGNPVAPVSPAGVCAGAAPKLTALPKATGRPSGGPAATPGSTSTAAMSSTETASSAEVAAATAGATTAVAVGGVTVPAPGAGDRVPAPSPGPDPGLLIAAVAGGGLAGLALLRLLGGRRGVR
jgi:hypothetical protein